MASRTSTKNAMKIAAFLCSVLMLGGYAHGETSSDRMRSVFTSPIENGYVVDGVVPVTMRCLFKPHSNNPQLPLNFSQTEFPGIWYATYTVTGLKNHDLPLDVTCGLSRYSRTLVVTNISSLDRSPARKMAQTILQDKPAAELKWDWTDAIMLFGLESWAQANSSDYLPVSTYIRYYQQHFGSMQNPPVINWADRCPSALTAVTTWQRFGQQESLNNLTRVTDYIRSAPKNRFGAINHFGTTLQGELLPPSIWLDSLMMYGLVSVKAGVARNDEELLNFGLRQQVIFADKMIDPATHLYYHAWNVNGDHPYPFNGTYWLRGNGWVGASLVLMLQELSGRQSLSPETLRLKSELEGLSRQLAAATRPLLPKTRIFDTLISEPGLGYQETSGTALLAYFYVQGAKTGVLDSSYGDLGRDIYRHLTARLEPMVGALISMPDISGPTMPYPPIGYALIPRQSDLPYGQGAYLLLAGAVNGDQ